MLSPTRDDDDDDDNHLCIKCNATIIGLDNYVKHRKEGCSKGKATVKTETVTSLSALDPSYSLGADVFFQSLELQSSSKRNPLQSITPPIRDLKPQQSKPVETVIVPRRVSPEPSRRGEDWIGGHSLRITGNEDNQTKLINVVANISGATKKDVPRSTYNLTPYSDFKHDEDSNEESDESEEDEDDEPQTSGGKWKPPPHYTGGKWKPEGTDVGTWRTRQVSTPDLEDWDLREEHTGGKWKPGLADKMAVDDEREEDDDAPPPGHTKGKWVPGAVQVDKTQIMHPKIRSKGSVQYWCGPCNRRLGSRAIYEKHLMSNFHLRKTLPENDLEFSGHINSIKYNLGKRSTKPSRYIDDSLYTYPEKKKIKETPNKIEKPLKIKKRRPYFMQCSGCKSRVRIHLMGKHLISHYHFRKVNTMDDVYKNQILDHIKEIVHQSPFQCSPCKFYTNWLSDFMKHWFSEKHVKTLSNMEGRIWCSFCKFECESSNDMLNHMSSEEHREVVSVINRSMPIIIRKKTVFSCEVCKKEFRYNVELKFHSRKTGHPIANTASDVYQELHKCKLCEKSFKSPPTLAAHLKREHKQTNVFFCLLCDLTFKTSDMAVKHRKSQEHKIKSETKRVMQKDLTKKCPYCIPTKMLGNLLELKKHIKTEHPETKRKCPKCGMSFVLPQGVTSHVRRNECQFKGPDLLDPMASRMLWHCSQCLYQTDSQAECIFHEALHSTPKKIESKSKTLTKYECQLCHKYFLKNSLMHHVRVHTSEKPHKCNKCGANFFRLQSLINHNKLKHEQCGEFKCTDCDATFQSQGSLRQHARRHSARRLACPLGCGYQASRATLLRLHALTHRPERAHACDHEGCGYTAKTEQQLKRHRRVHGDRSRQFACALCPFASDQSSHLKRHLRCHNNAKPYRCTHCTYVCATLENLRKHILKSRKHSRVLYRCGDCGDYDSALARDLRNHLLHVHKDKYDHQSAKNYVTKYFLADKNSTQIPTDSVQIIENRDYNVQNQVLVGTFQVNEDGILEPYNEKPDLQ